MQQVSSAKLAIARFDDETVVVINHAISMPSEVREINISELNLDVTGIPEAAKKIWKIGILPHEFLKRWGTIRTKVDNLCRRACAMTDIGSITSRKQAVETVVKLKEEQARFEALKRGLTRQAYEKECQLAISTFETAVNTEQEQLGDEARLPDSVIEKMLEKAREKQLSFEAFLKGIRFRHSVQLIRLDLNEFDEILFEEQKRGLAFIRDNVMGSLVQELARKSNDILDNIEKQVATKSNTGGCEMVVRKDTVRVYLDLYHKIDELQFVHPNLRLVAKEMKVVLDKLSTRFDALRGQDFTTFQLLVTSLSDQHRLLHCLENNLPIVEFQVDESQLKLVCDEEPAQQFVGGTDSTISGHSTIPSLFA